MERSRLEPAHERRSPDARQIQVFKVKDMNMHGGSGRKGSTEILKRAGVMGLASDHTG